MRLPVITLALSALIGLLSVHPSTSSPPNKLLLVLVDGFRWDYMEKFSDSELPGFTRLRQNGVTVDEFVSAFPTLSYVNYYSIMTGLHPETHGMVDNFMYDIKHDSEFLIGRNPEQHESYWWDDGEPLWITAAKQNKRSYFWFWSGCEVEIRGHRPTFCSPYQSTPNPSIGNFSMALNQAFSVLHNDSADLAGVYVELVDHSGHLEGPNSIELKEAIKLVDAELVKLLDSLDETADINLMVFSDHGMSERVGGPSDASLCVIHMLDYINSSDWSVVQGSPGLQLWPQPGMEELLYERLRSAHPNMTVYRKQDIPERYHLKNHYRVPPLLLEVAEGYTIATDESTREHEFIGFHGYDNSILNTHGIFFVSGPDFKRNTALGVSRLPNVNVYQLMCHVMQLVAAPHNGTWSNVCDALVDNDACEKGPYDEVSNAAISFNQDLVGFFVPVAVLLLFSL